MNIFMKKQNILKELLILTGAIALIDISVYFFLIPSHTAISSISGLAIVLSNFIPLSISAISMVLNVGLLVVGFVLCGPEFGYKTVYTSIVFPIFLAVLEVAVPNNQSLTGDQTLDVVAYILIVSVGLSILFNRNASSGGLDIVAKILNKFFHIELGKAMALAGMCVALSAALVYDSKTVVLSVIGTYFNGIAVDYFIFGQNEKKRVCIVSRKEEEIRTYILHELHSGATIYEAIGAYELEKHREIIAIVDKHEYQKLMNFLNEKDPDAFITVYSVHDMRYKPKTR